MTSNPIRRLLCLFGIHKRSRGGIREVGDTVLSNCKYCGVPMYKLDGKWLIRH
jgi:hypothetical protein